MRFRPHAFHESGKAFVEPNVAPVFARDEVAEPLMAELVRDKVIFVLEDFRCDLRMVQGAASVGGGAGVFHAASNEVIDHHLRVFFPGIVHAELFAEKIDHLGSTTVIHGKTISAALWSIVGDGHATPRVLYFVELSGNNGDEIGGAGNGFAPGPGP